MYNNNPEFEKIKKAILREILTKEALERLGRVRLVKPEFASKVELYLLQLYKAGKIKEPITDKKLKKILMLISGSR